MEMVIHHSVIQHVDGHGGSQLLEPISDPFLTVAEVLLRGRIESTEESSLRAAIVAVVDANRIGIDNVSARRTGHHGVSGHEYCTCPRVHYTKPRSVAHRLDVYTRAVC